MKLEKSAIIAILVGLFGVIITILDCSCCSAKSSSINSVAGRDFDSSAIESIQYNASTGQMVVSFVDQNVYTHEGVPAETHDQLISADSVGAFYTGHIRSAYPAAKQAE